MLRAFGPESTPYPVEGPIKHPEDIKTYQPPDPEADDVLGHLPEVVARYKGKKAICAICRDAFFNPSYLRGQEVFLMDMIDHPKLVHELIDIALSYDLRVTERLIQAGAEVVVLGDDYAAKNGPMMSPRHFREFILPGLKRAVDTAHRAGCLRRQAQRRQHHASTGHDRRGRGRRHQSAGATGGHGHRTRQTRVR